MHGLHFRNPKAVKGNRTRFLMVSAGIVLFIVGFVITLAAIRNDQSNQSSGTSERFSSAQHEHSDLQSGFYLLSGILVSLSGVVLATVGPAAGLIKKKNGN